MRLSGQLGARPDETLSAEFDAQADQAWANVVNLLQSADMSVADVTKVTACIVGAEHVRAYVAVHRRWTEQYLPPWTLVLVAGLGRPEFLVEVGVEAMR